MADEMDELRQQVTSITQKWPVENHIFVSENQGKTE
jgi:hypothetical protein